jgi:hypothetical protein
MEVLATVAAYTVGTLLYALILQAKKGINRRRARLQATGQGETGVEVVLVSPDLEEVERVAKQMEQEGEDVGIIKLEKMPLMERIKKGANNYKALQDRVGQNEIGNANQKQRNAYQNNLMTAAYGDLNENTPAPAPAPPAPSRWSRWFGRGGSRSKRSTKRRRNGRKSSRR